MPEAQVINSLTGTASPLLLVDVSMPSELDYASLWLPREWKKTTPYVTDFQRLDPNGSQPTTLSGNELNFEFVKSSTLIDAIVGEINLPGHTVTPVNANVSYTDWVGLAIWEKFIMKYHSNDVFELQPHDEYLRIRKTLDDRRLASMRVRCAGDQTTAQLSALLRNGTGNEPLLFPIYLPYADCTSAALPIIVLSQKTRYTIKLRALGNIIHNLSNAVITPNGPYEFKLLFELVHTTGHESEMFIALAEEVTGISYMVHQHQRQESEHATQLATKITTQLRGISRPLVYFNWGLIPSRLINNTGYNDFFMFNPSPPLPIPAGMNPYTPIDRWAITSNGQYIQREIKRGYTTYYNYDRFNFGYSGEDLYDQDYSRFPHSDNCAAGFVDYSNLSNPTLEIWLGAGGTGVDPLNPLLPQTLTCMVNCKDYNFWFLKGGNLTRCFN